MSWNPALVLGGLPGGPLQPRQRLLPQQPGGRHCRILGWCQQQGDTQALEGGGGRGTRPYFYCKLYIEPTTRILPYTSSRKALLEAKVLLRHYYYASLLGTSPRGSPHHTRQQYNYHCTTTYSRYNFIGNHTTANTGHHVPTVRGQETALSTACSVEALHLSNPLHTTTCMLDQYHTTTALTSGIT